MSLHEASLSLGGAPYRGVLLLEVFFFLGQVNQASAEDGR